MPQHTGPDLPAITLHQPWESLVAHGIKNVETRSWPPPHGIIGERIAIHASRTVVLNPGHEAVTAIADIYGAGQWRQDIPRGAVIAIATLSGAQKSTACETASPTSSPAGKRYRRPLRGFQAWTLALAVDRHPGDRTGTGARLPAALALDTTGPIGARRDSPRQCSPQVYGAHLASRSGT